LNWSGDRDDAHNVWHRLLLAHYSPLENGQPLVGPACYLTWGNEPLGKKLERTRELIAKKIPFDVYWIDAGWYGNEDYQEGSNVFNTPWTKNRGSWWPNKQCYPEGFQPLSELLHRHGMGFLLWFEPEAADPETTLMTEHPHWFLKREDGGLLNLGDPEARKGITDLVSGLIAQGGIDWYRQDFNSNPAGLWADAPDRVGMAEIRYIEGLYAFWDDLRARHPGLKIDNCASGGKRLDLETISRSMSLWRSDYCCFPPPEATGVQLQTLGLAPWVPLNVGCCEGNDTYTLRSAYGPGLVVDSGACMVIPKDDAWLKAGLEEFRRARPFFYGDFYPLLSNSVPDDCWSAMQWDRPDLKAGMAMFFRRPGSPFASMEVHLRKLDPAATYSVEIRPELAPGSVQTMSGEALLHLTLTIPTEKGSALLFYQRL